MATQWQIRRGTRAELDVTTLAEGELCYITDDDTIYIGSGSVNYLIGRCLLGGIPVDPGVEGQLHVNSSTQKLYYSNGTNWVLITDPSYFLTGGAIEIDGDRLNIDWNPSYSTPATVSETTSVDDLSSHLKGIDTAINTKSDTAHTHAALYSALDHDSSHITSGSDVIDGDKLDVSWDPTYYTPALVTNYSTSLDNLTSHLKGIDTAINTKSDTSHAHASTYSALDHDASHILSGSDEVDGDKLGISWNPSYSTPTVVTETDSVDHLTSHLKGIDTAINTKSDTGHTHAAALDHDASHIKDGSDEFDADKADIDWNPSYYTPTTVTETTSVDHLSSHLKGIDTAINGKSDTGHNHDATYSVLAHTHAALYSALDHDASHIKDGSDEFDADKADIDWNPSYYTPTTVTETTSVDHLSSHLKGIDTAINGKSDTGHNHDATYSVLAHTHAALYSALDHDASHITGGSDVIDGDKLEVSWSPANYTRTLVTDYSTSTSDLTSHLKGY